MAFTRAGVNAVRTPHVPTKARGPKGSLLSVRLPTIRNSLGRDGQSALNSTVDYARKTPANLRHQQIKYRIKSYSLDTSSLSKAEAAVHSVSLEKLHELEENLWTLHEAVIKGEGLMTLIQKYWSGTDSSVLYEIEGVFQEFALKKATRTAIILEFVVVCVLGFCFRNPMVWPVMVAHAKKACFYIHQNFLILVNLILAKVPTQQLSSMWGQSLQSAVDTRMLKKPTRAMVLLKHYTDLGINSMRTITNGIRIGKQFIREIEGILSNIEKMGIQTAREQIKSLNDSAPVVLEGILTTPYLPKAAPNTYTLVLDLDETLVHFRERDQKLLIRPFSKEFLEAVNQHYELVIFTAAEQDYADWAINSVDLQKLVKHRLYRQHAIPAGPVFIKDLRRLGRPLERVVIVDNMRPNFQLQPDNGICVKTWVGDKHDSVLKNLAQLLKSKDYTDLVAAKPADIREELKQLIHGES